MCHLNYRKIFQTLVKQIVEYMKAKFSKFLIELEKTMTSSFVY